ncbi:MAG: hypothetical protein ACE5R6_20305 [Candidatus Heimdallarchaeota archaeon]
MGQNRIARVVDSPHLAERRKRPSRSLPLALRTSNLAVVRRSMIKSP